MHAMPKKMPGICITGCFTRNSPAVSARRSPKGKLKMLKRAQIDSTEILEDPTIERVGGMGGFQPLALLCTGLYAMERPSLYIFKKIG
jgi:hypothetical protein